MTTTIKRRQATAHPGPSRAAILQRLAKSTRAITASTILPVLEKKGAVELSITDLRKRLSNLKTPLSHEIIAERKRT